MYKIKQPSSLNGIEFDALISEDPVYEADVPEFPVESGFTVSDAVIRKSIVVDVKVFITDTPVTWLNRFGDINGRRNKVIKQIEALYFSGSLVTLKTPFKTYTDMVITKFSPPRSTDTGYAILASIQLKHVPITKTKTIAIDDSYGLSGESETTAGETATKEPTTSERVKSFLAMIFGTGKKEENKGG